MKAKERSCRSSCDAGDVLILLTRALSQSDSNFGTITRTELEVVRADGRPAMWMFTTEGNGGILS